MLLKCSHHHHLCTLHTQICGKREQQKKQEDEEEQEKQEQKKQEHEKQNPDHIGTLQAPLVIAKFLTSFIDYEQDKICLVSPPASSAVPPPASPAVPPPALPPPAPAPLHPHLVCLFGRSYINSDARKIIDIRMLSA